MINSKSNKGGKKVFLFPNDQELEKFLFSAADEKTEC